MAGVETQIDIQLAGDGVSNECGLAGTILSGVGHIRVNYNVSRSTLLSLVKESVIASNRFFHL